MFLSAVYSLSLSFFFNGYHTHNLESSGNNISLAVSFFQACFKLLIMTLCDPRNVKFLDSLAFNLFPSWQQNSLHKPIEMPILPSGLRKHFLRLT